MLGEAFYETRRLHGFEPYDVRANLDNPDTRAELAADAANAFLAFDSRGGVVGCASVGGDSIDTVAVLPEHRRKGYGRRLTQFCVNLLLDRGIAVPRTSVLDDNVPARALYTRFGFRHVETYEDATLKVKG